MFSNKMKKIFLPLAALSATTASANVVLPFMVLLAKVNQAISLWIVIALAMFVEFLVFSWLLPKVDRFKIAIATILMNLASTLIGAVALLLGDFLVSFLMLAIFPKNIPMGSLATNWQEIFYSLWFIVFTVIVNTFIEFIVARLYLGKMDAKKLLFYIFLINAISVTMCVGGTMLYEYAYGPLPMRF